jgi:hypothetical protein
MNEPEIDTDKAIDDMTNRELRAKIATMAAHRPPDHGLNKNILNSAHAWFTGEFYLTPGHMKPGFPPKRELLETVLKQAIDAYAYDDFDLKDPERDGWPEHPAKELLYYWADDVKVADDVSDHLPRAMNKGELKAFLNAMKTNEDQREWSP